MGLVHELAGGVGNDTIPEVELGVERDGDGESESIQIGAVEVEAVDGASALAA